VRSWLCFVLSCAALLALPTLTWSGVAHAADAGDSERVTFGGSFRTTTAASVDTSSAIRNRVNGLNEEQLRLTAEGPLGGDALHLQVHGVQYFSSGRTLSALLANAPRRFRMLRDDQPWLASNGNLMFGYFDRMNLRLSAGPLDLTIGRQAINLSSTFLWSPLDVYRPFAPWVFDRDYKSGVDAIKLSCALGSESGLDLIASGGRTLFVDPVSGQIAQSSKLADLSLYGSSALARVFTSLGSLELTAQGGKTYGAYQVGLGFAAHLDDWGFRGEGVKEIPERLDPTLAANPLTEQLNRDLVPRHLSGVLGIDRKFENGASVLVEYFYNGAGRPHDYARAGRRLLADEIVNLNQHLAGLLIRQELSPLLKVRSLVIVAPTEPSALLNESFSYSTSDESELLVGAIFCIGRSSHAQPTPVVRSEFGSFGHLGYAEWKLYF
jgi:hypothetical protein